MKGKVVGGSLGFLIVGLMVVGNAFGGEASAENWQKKEDSR